ncbi:MAG: hypothetical protein U0T68_14590 [Ferruginibacter sp.]
MGFWRRYNRYRANHQSLLQASRFLFCKTFYYNNSGCGISKSFSVTKPVVINNVFAVDFAVVGGCAGYPVQFNDSTLLSVGNITGHIWDFGDASPPSNY